MARSGVGVATRTFPIRTALRPAAINILVVGVIKGREGIGALKRCLRGFTKETVPHLVMANATDLIEKRCLPELTLEVPTVLTAGIPMGVSDHEISQASSRVLFPINQDVAPADPFRVIRLPGLHTSVAVVCAAERFLNSVKYKFDLYRPEMEDCGMSAELCDAVSSAREQTPIVLMDFYSQGFMAKRELAKFLRGSVTYFGGSQMELPIGEIELKKGTAIVADSGKVGVSTVFDDTLEIDGVLLSADPATGEALSAKRIIESFKATREERPTIQVMTPPRRKDLARILAVGDVNEHTVPFVERFLQERSKSYDGVIVNGEHAWEGLVNLAGIDCLTNGNHSMQGTERVEAAFRNNDERVIFPGNVDLMHPWNKDVVALKGKDPELAGRRLPFFRLCENDRIMFGVMNLGDPTVAGFGPLFAPDGRLNPDILEGLETLRSRTKLIFVDFHSESLQEKLKLARALDGNVTTLYGTHQHQQYLRHYIFPGGMGLFFDIGFTGFYPNFIRTINPFSFYLSFGRNYWEAKRNSPEVIPRHLAFALSPYTSYKDPVKRDIATIQGIEIEADRNTGSTLDIKPISVDVPLRLCI